MAVANALKETKLPATLCRMSPPSSPSRARVRSASQLAGSSASDPPLPRKSRLLATLDAEIPQWLSGPTATLKESANTSASKTVPPIADPKPIHPFFMSSQTTGSIQPKPRERAKTAPASSASSKGKSREKLATATLESDVENHPEGAMEVDGEVTAAVPEPSLPLYSYKDYDPSPAVVYTPHEEEANDLVQCLKGPVLGFDFEWVVKFRRGKTPMSHRTALVQLSDARMILLVQVSAMKKFPQKVKEIIENKDIIKLGANIKNDGQKLFNDFGILGRNLVELGAIARHVDPSFAALHKRSIVSLAKVVEAYTRKTLDKGKVRTSNWEVQPLSEAQKFYAANDAHCALMVYNRLVALAEENGVTLIPADFGADLAKEYQLKQAKASTLAAQRVAVHATNLPSSSSSTTPTSAQSATRPPSSASAVAAPSTSSASSSHPKPASSTYGRPLVFAGESSAGPSSHSSPSHSSSNPKPGSSAREPPRPQHLRAYNLWHHRDMPLPDICAALRSKDNPLAHSTVISYVVRALQADPTLPFSMDRLKAFVQLESGSWTRHRDWILQMDGYSK
ncbi:ribonuclease H-like protein [Trametes cingulata]|nr:ribonuclease H-like protein [Trametes cingulata]